MDQSNTGEYRAEIIACDDDGPRIQSIRAIPGIAFIDTLDAQLADLLRTRRPDQTMGQHEIQQAVRTFLSENGGNRYGVWAYFPWSGRVVRLLPEAEFVELRTSRNQHKITIAEQRALATRAVGVVGLSVGQAIALTIALERSCGELRLADFDAIDLSNLNRLRCGVHNLGVLKTVAAAREIAEIDPFLRVRCFHDGYTAGNASAFLDGLDVLIDECDSLDVKFRLREAAQARRIPVLMSASDRGMVDIERFDEEPDRPPFHGRLDGLQADALAELTTEEKVPVLLEMAGLHDASARLRASMLEIDVSIRTWPQLAADVAYGGAAICNVARRVLLGEPAASGCYRSDFEDIGDPAKALPVRRREVGGDSTSETVQPATGDALERIVADAALAPSAGNDQPWSWQRTRNGLTLRQRRSHHANPAHADNKISLVGLGAALESAVIAARHEGLDAHVDAVLDADHIADLHLSPALVRLDEPLHAQLSRRRSVRTRPTVVEDLDPATLAALQSGIADFDGIHLTLLTDADAIQDIGGIAGEAERLRILDPVAHADFVREVCWSDAEHRERREGIPLDALCLTAAERAGLTFLADPAVMRTLTAAELGHGLRKLSLSLATTASAIGLLWTSSDTAANYLRGGQALQRIWLTATAANVGLCPITAACYLFNAWRNGHDLTTAQTRAAPVLEERFRHRFDLPAKRGDIALFRLVPAAAALTGAPITLRRRDRLASTVP